MRSMTGFGRARSHGEHYTIEIELRSWNHKGFDVQFKLPSTYGHLESVLREKFARAAARGKGFCQVSIQGVASEQKIRIIESQISRFVIPLKHLANNLDLTYQLTTRDLFDIPGAYELTEEPSDEVSESILNTFNEALEQWDASRSGEGQRHAEALNEHLDEFSKAISVISDRRGETVRLLREKIASRVKDIVESTGIQADEKRLEMEVAMLAEKADIEEEVVRATAHIAQLKRLFEDTSAKEVTPVGAEINFLMQEALRETNTIASKTQDLKTIQTAVDAKKAIDRMRELAANVV